MLERSTEFWYTINIYMGKGEGIRGVKKFKSTYENDIIERYGYCSYGCYVYDVQ